MSSSGPSSPWLGRLQTLASGLGLLVTLVVMLAIVHEMFPDFLRRKPPTPQPHVVSEWSAIRATGHRTGNVTAPVEVVEFTDFECPACARMASTLARLDERFPGRLAVIVRHFPLTSIHPLAMPAAVAAECAATQGAFASFYKMAFAQQDSLGLRSFAALASQTGVRDTAAFNRCLGSEAARVAVNRDVTAGNSLGIHGTPTLIINGTLYPQSPSEADLEHLLTAAR